MKDHYCFSKARDTFVREVNSQRWGTRKRIAAENILIAYDQLREELDSKHDGITQRQSVKLQMKLPGDVGVTTEAQRRHIADERSVVAWSEGAIWMREQARAAIVQCVKRTTS